MKTPAYRYLLCDLLTDRKLVNLPLSGVQFDRRISRTGSLSGQFSAPNKSLVNMAKIAYEYAGRSALWVYRNNELWWGGIPWTVQVNQDDRGAISCGITAATFDSYAHHRELHQDVDFPDFDQGAIIPELWRQIQSDSSGDIGVVALDQVTGITRDRVYLGSDLAKVGKLIEDLGDIVDGPEHTIDVYADASGARIKSLRVANRLGGTAPKVVFTRARRGGGRISTWSHVADAVDGGTSFRARGDASTTDVSSDGQPLLSDQLQRTDLLDAGWPLIDVSADYPGVNQVSALNGWAEGLSQQNGGAMNTSGYTVDVGTTGWNPNRIGEAVRLKINDLWHDNTDLTVRPVGCTVQPPEKGSAERVTLLLGDES